MFKTSFYKSIFLLSIKNLFYLILTMNKRLKKLFKDYDDNLLNYFVGLSPEESKTFNRLVKENKNK